MKKDAKPQLIAGWWRVNLPQGLSSAKDLEKALAGYEASLKQLVKSGGAEDCKTCLETIDELAKIATKLQSEAQKAFKAAAKDEKFDAADYANTVEVLRKLPAKLEEARDEADELQREKGGLFGDPQQYQPYLQKWLKKAKHKPLTFAFVAGASSLEHRVMLHGSRDPGTLLTKLKQETKLKKGIFGMAGAHAEQNTTLVLELYTKPLPGLAKKFRLLLKRFKPLPFERVLLTMEGEEVADIPDPEDSEAEEIERAKQPDATSAEALSSTGAPAAKQTEPAAARGNPALESWQAARASVVEQLKQLGVAIAATKDTESKRAIIMLQAIIKNLTAAPDTRQSVLELERYLTTDDLISDVESPNPFGVAINVRQPLLDALASLKASHAF